MGYGSISADNGEGKTTIQLTIDPDDPFGEKEIFANDDFWKEVREACKGEEEGKSKEKVQRKVRVKWLTEKLAKEHPGKDLLEYMLTIVHDEYLGLEYANQIQDEYHYPTFVYELSEFALVILENDNAADEKYKELSFHSEGSPYLRTILHTAAERSLTQIIKYMVEFYPKLVHIPTNVDDDDYYPLHFLLEKKDKQLTPYLQKQTDESASFLISIMNNERVRDLFETSGRKTASFFFRDFIVHGGYDKTCIAILDCLVNPDWPFIKNDEDEDDDFTSCIPNVPVRYHFFYRILDGDDRGQSPESSTFNHSAKSCLQLLAENTSKEDAMNHPAVRTLIRHKWDSYAKYITMTHASIYVLFLVMLSVALFTQPMYRKSTTYDGPIDTLRAVCEIGSLFFTLMYMISEALQLYAERCNYFRDCFNYLDNLGMISIFLIIPLRYTDHHDVEWVVAGIGFAINFIRVIKYFPASRPLGVYSKTIARIIYYDVSKFFIIFFIVMFGYVGMVFLVLRGFGDLKLVGGFWDIFLREIRALTEGKEFNDDYEGYNVFVIIILMLNMCAILVVMLNLLIGQISYRYEEALGLASISYDVDRCILVAKAERTPFKIFCNFRVKYYKDADFVTNETVAEELVEDWLASKKHDKIEKRQKAIKEFLKNRSFKRRSMKKNPNSVSLVAPE